MRSLLALVLLVVASATTAVYRLNHDAALWPPDAAIYLRMTLEDRGIARDEARDRADAFLRTTSSDPDSRAFYGAHPPAYYARQFDLFRTRPLFPRVAALLYPRFGPHALQIVAALAYVVATCLLFAILLPLAPPWLAALGAFAFATAPSVLDVAALGLTDSPALLFWIASLGAILAFVRRPSAAALAAVALASLLLAFTRPAVFLPVGASLGAWYALRNDPAGRRAMTALVATTAGVAVVFLAYSAVVHGPGLAEQLGWEYDWQRAIGGRAAAHGFAAWYASALLRIVGDALTFDVYKNGALLGLVLAALGIAAARRTPLVAVLAGAACASLVALVANPLEFVRSAELPLVPVVVILATVALAVLVRAVRGQEARGAGAP
jgi:hypothetical protein